MISKSRLGKAHAGIKHKFGAKHVSITTKNYGAFVGGSDIIDINEGIDSAKSYRKGLVYKDGMVALWKSLNIHHEQVKRVLREHGIIAGKDKGAQLIIEHEDGVVYYDSAYSTKKKPLEKMLRIYPGYRLKEL